MQGQLLSLYQRMKARGVDMGWYERSKARRAAAAVPLETEQCGLTSIYFLKMDGSLWTTKTNGTVHRKVREGQKELPKTVYLCMCCKQQANDYESLREHLEQA